MLYASGECDIPFCLIERCSKGQRMRSIITMFEETGIVTEWGLNLGFHSAAVP